MIPVVVVQEAGSGLLGAVEGVIGPIAGGVDERGYTPTSRDELCMGCVGGDVVEAVDEGLQYRVLEPSLGGCRLLGHGNAARAKRNCNGHGRGEGRVVLSSAKSREGGQQRGNKA